MGSAAPRPRKVPRRLRIVGAKRAELGLLTDLTGHDDTFWFAGVQEAIQRAGYGRLVKGHRRNRNDWPVEVMKAIWGSFPEGEYDGNMRFALVAGLVYLGWYARLHRAKAMDPNRPLAVRRQAYTSWLRCAQAAMMLWVDERNDATKMPQKWNNPFWPGARGGRFL